VQSVFSTLSAVSIFIVEWSLLKALAHQTQDSRTVWLRARASCNTRNFLNCVTPNYSLGGFSATQICSRLRTWPACVAFAKNNYICVSIVKRDKRTRDVGCCGTYPCVSMPTTSVSILDSGGAHAPYCTNDCLYRHATESKQKLKLRMKFYACGSNPRA
jgi:hypothetical protein